MTLIFIGLFFVVLSCGRDRSGDYGRVVEEWVGQEIAFPEDPVFTVYLKDTVPVNCNVGNYKIISYIDSSGCVSCKLQLAKWKETMAELNEAAGYDLTYLFFFNPQDIRELGFLLRRDEFDYPVCIDADDEMNRLNRFPVEYALQTFLVDTGNRVVLVGNPIMNVKVKQLYKERISTKTSRESVRTEADISLSKIDFGEIAYGSAGKRTVYLRNTGKSPLVILDYVASCGCTTVDYEKRPVLPGDSLEINIRFDADEYGPFRKTLRIYANIPSSSVSILLMGEVKKTSH